MEAISIGPTIRFLHSPDEHVDVASVQRFWRLLTAVLGRVPERHG
jgi:dipeptidase D